MAAEAHERYAQPFAFNARGRPSDRPCSSTSLDLRPLRFIIGHQQTPEHVKARTDLLKPILDQDYGVAEARRQRKPVVDVDPNTGEPVPAPTEPSTPGDPVDHG